jgi:hypothetical protein
MVENQEKHLEMIQSIISRMNSNSFSVKAWSVGLVSALFVLAAEHSNERYAIFALLPALVFWGLDAYYLRTERLFRKLYDAVRGVEGLLRPEPFSMNTEPYEKLVDCWYCTLGSCTILPVHLVIITGVVVATIVAALR